MNGPGSTRPREQNVEDTGLRAVAPTSRQCPGCGESAARGAVTVIRDRYDAGRAWHTRCLERDRGLRASREADRVNRLPQRVGQPPEELTTYEAAQELLSKVGPELIGVYMQRAHELDAELSTENLVIFAARLAREDSGRVAALRSRVARDRAASRATTSRGDLT